MLGWFWVLFVVLYFSHCNGIEQFSLSSSDITVVGYNALDKIGFFVGGLVLLWPEKVYVMRGLCI